MRCRKRIILRIQSLSIYPERETCTPEKRLMLIPVRWGWGAVSTGWNLGGTSPARELRPLWKDTHDVGDLFYDSLDEFDNILMTIEADRGNKISCSIQVP